MSEEKEKTEEETEEEEQEKPVDNTPERDKSKKTSILDEANAVYKRMEEQLQAYKLENDRREEIMARQMLAGRADATIENQKEKEETPQEYVDKVMKGEIND